MKLLPRVRSAHEQQQQQQQQKSPHKYNGAPSLQATAPHPCQLKCKVKGPDGNQVALVPICLPLSIMASYAVKAAGGTDEVACIASVAVIAQGNAVVSRMKTEALLTERDVNEYIDTIATNTRETMISSVGDYQIADEVEAMIRGGAQLILNSNKEENAQQMHEESRDDDENDLTVGEDVQSIATSVLQNFDQNLMMGTSNNEMTSPYAIDENVGKNPKQRPIYTWGPSGSCSTTVVEVQNNDKAERAPSRFGFWAWQSPQDERDDNNIAMQVTESTSGPGSLDKILQKQSLHPPRQQASGPTFTWDTSNNANEYETTSNFVLDTFHPVPQNFYQSISHDFLGCPNFSMEPTPGDTPTKPNTSHDENRRAVVKKTDSSDYTMTSADGRGIFAIHSNLGANNAIPFPANAAGVSNLQHVSNSSRAQEHVNANHSVTTRSIESQIGKRGCCSFKQHPCTGPDNSPPTPAAAPRNDQESANSPQTYQSYMEPGKECDDITFLNVQESKQSLFTRVRRVFGKMNCKSGHMTNHNDTLQI